MLNKVEKFSKTCKLGLSLLTLLSLTACAKSIGGIKPACSYFPPPSYSSQDTKETQQWFEGVGGQPGYAVKYDRLCGDK